MKEKQLFILKGALFLLLTYTMLPSRSMAQDKPRARDLGVPFAGTPGPFNAITDVQGVEVGHTTLITGDGALVVGEGPVRTGVTAILPRGKEYSKVFAGWYSLNGNGEMTGTTWVEESGMLGGPVMITNTHSVGIVRDAVVEWLVTEPISGGVSWALPVVAETYDGFLNDINGFHVTKEHTYAALNGASSGPVAEGGVGGGTGMICFDFKCGIGTASRIVSADASGYTVGVLVQANFARRPTLTIAGVPIGREIPDLTRYRPDMERDGSIIVVVATDAPLMSHQLKRLARRVPLGIGRMGGLATNGSGDIFIAFSTANEGAGTSGDVENVEMLTNHSMDPLIQATVQAVEEAIVNALVAGETLTGINGNTVYGIPHDRLRDALRKYNRLVE